MNSMTGPAYQYNKTGNAPGKRGALAGENIPSGYRKATLSNYTPEQHDLYKQMFSQVSPDSYLARLAAGDEGAFEQMEAPEWRQFNEGLGGIAARFSNQGLGGRRSSGFQNTTSAAASNFAQDLARRRQELQRQAVMDLSSLSTNLLGQRPYENSIYQKREKQGTDWGSIAGGALTGGLTGFLAGGPVGAAVGAGVGGLQGYQSSKGGQSSNFNYNNLSGLR